MPKNDRMLLVKIKSSPYNVNILVTYTPTSEAEDHGINSYYRDLDELYSGCESNEITILMSDLNAKVGAGKDDKTVGPHGLGERNERQICRLAQSQKPNCRQHLIQVTSKKTLYLDKSRGKSPQPNRLHHNWLTFQKRNPDLQSVPRCGC